MGEGSAEKSKGRGEAPLLFVSVASKGFSEAASLLFATLARSPVNVADKELTEAKSWRESNPARWGGLEGVRRTAERAGSLPHPACFS